MSEVSAREQLSKLVASFMAYSAGHLPDDVKTRLAQMKEIENGFRKELDDLKNAAKKAEKAKEAKAKKAAKAKQDKELLKAINKIGLSVEEIREKLGI